MMEVLTLPIWKTSTCLMLPLWRGSPALTCPRSVGSMSSAWRSWASTSSRNERSSRAGSPRMTSGVDGVAVRAFPGGRWSAGWRTSRSAGGRRLTCTLLVTCAVEHVGYVVGGHGLGLELSAGQSDGDVLQGA